MKFFVYFIQFFAFDSIKNIIQLAPAPIKAEKTAVFIPKITKNMLKKSRLLKQKQGRLQKGAKPRLFWWQIDFLLDILPIAITLIM